MKTRGVLFAYSLYIALAIVIFPAVAPAQNEAPAFAEIFSKDDARAWFAMTRDEWQENVRRNVAAGAASALEAQETGVALVARSAAGDLFVIRPLYLSGPEKPDVVHVTVHYRGARAAQFADPMVERALSDARRVLAPEFELNDGVERTAHRLVVVLEFLERMPE